MVKKILKIGNSLGVTLSSVHIKTFKLKPGDLVDVPEHEIVLAEKGKKVRLEGVTPGFVSLVNETIEEYRPALRALAKK